MANTLSLVALLVLSGIAFAQSSGAIAPPSPQPNPEIKRLVEAFSGTWSITLKVEPNERLPKGGGGKGEEVWRPGPGALSLIEDYHSTGDEGEISGLGVAWWDSNAQRYQVLWCDSSNPNGCIVMNQGAKWEGGEMVAKHEWEKSGKKLAFKEVFSDITSTSFKQSLYQGEPGGELKKIVSILATKVTSTSAHPIATTPRSYPSQGQSLKMPGPAVQQHMLGEWSLKVKYEPSGEMPHGGTGEATEVWWPGPGGYSVIEEYYQNDAKGWTELFIPAWWDEQAGGQRFVGCGNTVPSGCEISKSVAKWEGNRNVYIEDHEEDGKKVTDGEVFEDISPTSFTQRLQKGESGAELKTVVTLRATKVSSTPKLRDSGADSPVTSK
jgi:hypothetical protein